MAAQTSPPSVADAVDVRPRVGGELLLLLDYAALALWWLWPAPRFWATHSAYDPGSMQIVATADFYLIVWAMSWVAASSERPVAATASSRSASSVSFSTPWPRSVSLTTAPPSPRP